MHSQTKEIRAAVIDDLSLTAACADLTGCRSITNNIPIRDDADPL
jgi:hypothetical protein